MFDLRRVFLSCNRPCDTDFTKASPKLGQSTLGKATEWALKPPVAPPNFAECAHCVSWSTHACRREAKTANSFPTRVGDALCPCVRASMATSRHFQARAPSEL